MTYSGPASGGPAPKPANTPTAWLRPWSAPCTQGVLPARAIDSLAQLQAVFAEVLTLLLEATERPVQRPRAVVDRAADYSGKKRLMRKNTLIADPQRYIHYLGPTTTGSTHDY